MSESIHYPSWQDIALPTLFVEGLRQIGSGNALDYLILNRVFRFNVRAQYIYECRHCGTTKTIARHYEDYSVCEHCGSNKICSTAYWRMGKDKIEPYSQRDGLASKIIQQMAVAYGQYFRDLPPDDFVGCKWEWSRDSVEIPQDGPAFGKHNTDPDMDAAEDFFDKRAPFSVQFCCGEKAIASTQTLAVCKAAILSPFLWDDRYDWKYNVRRDKGQETHMIPLLHMLARFKSGDKSSRPLESPKWLHPEPEGNPLDPGMAAGIPEAVMQVLQDDPGLIHGVFGEGPQ